MRPYRSSAGAFVVGQVIDDPRLEAWLVKDSPGTFERVEVAPAPPPLAAPAPAPAPIETAALDAPPEDKMLRRDERKAKPWKK